MNLGMEMGFGIRLVINTGPRALPSRADLDPMEREQLQMLQRRAHLKEAKVIRDKSGEIVSRLDPLSREERETLETLEMRVYDERMPKWGPLEYRFAAFGDDGCVWMLPDSHANLLVKNFGKRLKVITEEEVPKGVTPRRPSRIPSTFEQTYHARSRDELMSRPRPLVDGKLRGALVEIGDDGQAAIDYGDMMPARPRSREDA